MSLRIERVMGVGNGFYDGGSFHKNFMSLGLNRFLGFEISCDSTTPRQPTSPPIFPSGFEKSMYVYSDSLNVFDIPRKFTL